MKNGKTRWQVHKIINLSNKRIRDEIDKILSSLGFKCKRSKKSIKVEIPSWRPDVSLDEDLVEELIRIKGFDKIKIIAPEKVRNQDTLNYKQKLFHLSQILLSFFSPT